MSLNQMVGIANHCITLRLLTPEERSTSRIKFLPFFVIWDVYFFKIILDENLTSIK
jgi:hypothetical protein